VADEVGRGVDPEVREELDAWSPSAAQPVRPAIRRPDPGPDRVRIAERDVAQRHGLSRARWVLSPGRLQSRTEAYGSAMTTSRKWLTRALAAEWFWSLGCAPTVGRGVGRILAEAIRGQQTDVDGSVLDLEEDTCVFAALD
jgi:hypothetical protein